MSKILAAMSGGVDSSLAAALLVEQGHDVTGVHLKLAPQDPRPAANGRTHGCCSVADADDARRVAQALDIPFYVWNLADRFRGSVIDDFVGEYAAGRTPNPCIRCNERIKFGLVLERGLAMGFDAVATGHYAIARRTDRPRLFRSADRAKDQSYVLSSIGPDALSRALFPVGGLTKSQTREKAERRGLRTAAKPDSYDICFVSDGDAAGFVERALGGPSPGPIVDAEGSVVGEHAGVHRFTVGQRKGLGLATHERRFVLNVDPALNTVVVGAAELLARSRIVAAPVRWFGPPPPDGTTAQVQIRAHGAALSCTVTARAGETVVDLAQPERGIAPGQTIAFYDGDEVLGGGRIIARS